MSEPGLAAVLGAGAGAGADHVGPSEQALLRQQHALDDLCAASARALSAEPQLHYRQRRLYRLSSHRARRPPPPISCIHPTHPGRRALTRNGLAF